MCIKHKESSEAFHNINEEFLYFVINIPVFEAYSLERLIEPYTFWNRVFFTARWESYVWRWKIFRRKIKKLKTTNIIHKWYFISNVLQWSKLIFYSIEKFLCKNISKMYFTLPYILIHSQIFLLGINLDVW